MATKRTGDTVEQPADNKFQALEPPTTGVPVNTIPPVHDPSSKPRDADTMSKQPPSRGLVDLLAARLSGPISNIANIDIQVNTENYNAYFSSLRDTLISMIYPDSEYEDDGIITDEHWQLVCRYLMKGRIDTVYHKMTGRREERRISVASEHEVPKALADVINGIGAHQCFSGAFTVIPRPEANPADTSRNLSTLVTHTMLSNFQKLVLAAKRRSLISTGYISNIPTGRAYWLIAASIPRANTVATIEARGVKPMACFPDWTPADGILASIVCNRFDGTINTFPLIFEMDIIKDVPAIRQNFNLEA